MANLRCRGLPKNKTPSVGCERRAAGSLNPKETIARKAIPGRPGRAASVEACVCGGSLRKSEMASGRPQVVFLMKFRQHVTRGGNSIYYRTPSVSLGQAVT